MLAVAIQMLVLPILARLEWVELTVPSFYPLGAILGGYLFGLAMGWAGGCAAGIWYKWGAGSWRSFVAVLGLVAGAVTTESGPLRGMREQVQGELNSAGMHTATLGGVLHAEWMAYPLAGLLLLWLARSRVSAPPGAWTWPRTGMALVC